MRLKTYIVDSMSEAMVLIKKDLGSDALILNTKKVKKGGFLGFFKKDKFEVIAAVDQKPKIRITEPADQQPKARITEPTDQELKARITVAANQKPKTKITEPDSIKQTTYPVREVKAERPVVIAEKPLIPPKINPDTLSTELIKELKDLKQFMLQVIEDDRLPEVLKPLNKKLSNQLLSSEIQSEIIAKLMLVFGQNPKLTNEEIHSIARSEVIKIIEERQQILVNKDPEIICFIGPTGVGKTTTIAKIAADYLLKDNRKVGLITSDTYRIAAVEQLRTYANILNIPIKVVESANDLTIAMNELTDCDIILMDTAGRNYQQKEYIDELEQLLPSKEQIQINLVLSLTSKYEDMKKIIDNFKTVDMDRLVLTKQDETSSYGAIVNLIYDYSIPIHYITNGQNVPNDIVIATPELIANFLLGEDEI